MKKYKALIIIITFILSFIAHFGYDIIPNKITSIIFPVNESIWEHMKIILTCNIIGSVIEYLLYKKKGISFNNFLFSLAISSLSGIIIFLIIYKFISIFIPHNLIVSIILLLITYIVCGIISYKLLNYKKIKYQHQIGILILIISYSIFAYLTYHPIKTDLFIDPKTNTYGIVR